MRWPSFLLACALALLAAGCASPPSFDAGEAARLSALLPADVLLLGEQHDAPEHQQLERRTVQWLAGRGALAALVMEMAEQGHSTAGLPRGASEAEARAALDWSGPGWPWKDYGPVVMAAVRAGVPVLGANLPRALLRQAMSDATLDDLLPGAAFQAQMKRIREGHCNALPEAQIVPMTRMQIARDRAFASAVVGAGQPGRTVLLVTGGEHVTRTLGVPMHLLPQLKVKVILAVAGQAQAATDSEATDDLNEADLLWPTPPVPLRDYCAEFKTSRTQ